MKKHILKSLVLATLIISLSACGGGSPAIPLTPKQQLALLETSGVIPKLDRSSDLAGPDADSNGVRDDVDAFITTSYAQPSQRAAATQFANVLQAELTVDLNDSLAVRAISVRGSRAIHCIFTKFDAKNGSTPPASVAKTLIDISMSTKPRLLKYLAFSKALDGTTSTLPDGDTCEK